MNQNTKNTNIGFFKSIFLFTSISFSIIFGKYIVILKRLFNKKPNNTSNKILLLVSDFLPKINGGIYRPFNIAKHTPSSYQTKIITSHKNLVLNSDVSKSMIDELPNQSIIYTNQVNFLIPYKLGCILGPNFKDALEMFHYLDSYIKVHKPNTLIASGPNFYTFIVACALKIKFDVTVVLDYRDEWSSNPFCFVEKGIFDSKIEQFCLMIADKIIFTTESQIKLSQKLFPKVSYRKYTLINNSFDIPINSKMHSTIPDENIFNIVYSGNLGDYTSFPLFLSIIEQLHEQLNYINLEINIYGNISNNNYELISNSIAKRFFKLYGFVSQAEVSEALSKSNYSILFLDKNFDRYLPGKIYDYIAADVPIILFNSNIESEVTKITFDYPKSYRLEPNLDSFISFFIKRECIIKNNTIFDRDKFLNENSRKIMASKFFTTIDHLRRFSS